MISKDQASKNSIPDDPFRWILKEELLKRCEKNKGYSLRAYARDLDISASALSAILNRKRRLTDSMKVKLGLRIGLTPVDIQPLLEENEAKQSTQHFKAIDQQSFEIISDWYHYALIELLSIKKYALNSKTMARALGITVSEVNFALERLERVGMIEKKGNTWLNSSGNNTNIITGEHTSAAARKAQKQHLQKSIEAVDSISKKSRDHTGVTIATTKQKLNEAIQKIAEFRREMDRFLSATNKPDEVYHLQISFFPLTKSGEDHE